MIVRRQAVQSGGMHFRLFFVFEIKGSCLDRSARGPSVHGLVKEGALAILLRSVKWAGAGRTPRVDPALGLQTRTSGSDVTDRATRLFTRDGVGRPDCPKGMQVVARSRMLDEDLHSRSTHRDASGHEGNREDRGQVRPREPGHRLTHSEPEPCQLRTLVRGCEASSTLGSDLLSLHPARAEAWNSLCVAASYRLTP